MKALPSRFTISNAITAGLTAIERARGFLEEATLSDDWVRRMSQRALLLEAHHTTHIEGTHPRPGPDVDAPASAPYHGRARDAMSAEGRIHVGTGCRMPDKSRGIHSRCKFGWLFVRKTC
jgi:hypothetical protein